MSQDWIANLYTQATEADTTLSNMELMFATLKSLFAGAAAPANTVAYMPWGDSTKKVLKRRDDGDSAWFGLMHGDTSQKIWVYRNAAMEGWAIDSGVSDKVLALKGGATYTAGAATAGSFAVTDSGHTHASTLAAPNHTHTLGTDAGTTGTADQPVVVSGGYAFNSSGAGGGVPRMSTTTGNPTVTALTGSITSGTAVIADIRPAAAVGTLQYLDL